MTQDSIIHQFHKLQAEGAFRHSTTPTIQSSALNLPPPPAYSPSSTAVPQTNHADEDDDEYYSDGDDDPHGSPATTITVTAPIKVVGHGNILNTSNLTSMLSYSLTAALQQHQQQMLLVGSEDSTTTAPAGDGRGLVKEGSKKTGTRPALRPLHLNINCAVSIVGSRNVVGENVAKAALVARMTAASSAAAPGSAGAAPSTANPGTTTTGDVSSTRKRTAESVSSIILSSRHPVPLMSLWLTSKPTQEPSEDSVRPAKRLDTGE